MPEKKITYDHLKDVPASSWKKLTQKKIFWGHQSVGFNIMDGIDDTIKEHPEIKLNIVKTNKPADFKIGIFAHSSIGKNEYPKSKIDEFYELMNEGIGEKVDIAFYKFCYADVNATTDINKIFSKYKQSLARLKKKYPQTTFIHVTMPLTVIQTGPKAWIKKLVGKSIGGYQENINRNQFNTLLINEYKGKDPIFDLAKIESTFPNGTKATIRKDNKTYSVLVPEYTSDGKHLNEIGRRKAAEQLLLLLVNLS